MYTGLRRDRELAQIIMEISKLVSDEGDRINGRREGNNG